MAIAVRAGRLVPLACEECGHRPAVAHHEDYTRPLDVVWLCQRCHRALHGSTPPRTRRRRPPPPPFGAERLRLLRNRRVLTQKQLAERAGVRWQTISDIESGRHAPRATTIQKLAGALGVTPQALAGTEP